MFALPYLALGVTTYSSAIYNFVPEFALDFYAAVRRGDDAFVINALNEFVIPYCNLRNRKQGYAVSIIKGGMKVIGRDAGPVRSPADRPQRRRAGRTRRSRQEGELTMTVTRQDTLNLTGAN